MSGTAAGFDVLTLREAARPPGTEMSHQREGEHVARLRQPPTHLDLVVDGVPLQRLLVELPVLEPETYGFGDTFDLVSVADLAHPGRAADALDALEAEDRAAELAHRRSRSLRGRWRRLTGR
ncbi:hypothetical protein [Kineococcus sp. SYSU DK004]|uniref:hypothetical protein n=1 Tax=Kineococcus sp. SYSU DK004 TaxID=3383125 RepID=UPI003D7D45EB